MSYDGADSHFHKSISDISVGTYLSIPQDHSASIKMRVWEDVWKPSEIGDTVVPILSTSLTPTVNVLSRPWHCTVLSSPGNYAIGGLGTDVGVALALEDPPSRRSFHVPIHSFLS
jgi:hypothetical protein